METQILPRLMALKSKYDGKYLRYIKEEGSMHGFLQFSGDHVVSPYTKFEVELARMGEGLVHLRCCYNDKYWVRSSSRHDEKFYFAAAANKPDEERSSRNCTLFKPFVVYKDDRGNAKGIQLLHVQLGCYLARSSNGIDCRASGEEANDIKPCLGDAIRSYTRTLFPCPNHLSFQSESDVVTQTNAASSETTQFNDCLYAVGSDDDDGDGDNNNNVFEIVDWGSILIMPRYVAFKGYNGKYLVPPKGHRHHKGLKFQGSDKGASNVRNEVFTTPDGNIRIKNTDLNKFWRRGDKGIIWICPDTDATTYDDTSLFSPIKVNDNVIAIRNLDNKNFCRSQTCDGEEDCLAATGSTISEKTQICLEELVISREIYNTNFRFCDARIHSQRPDTTLPVQAVYNQTQVPTTMQLRLRYTDSKSSTWKQNASFKWGMKITIKTGIPSIVDGDVQNSAEYNGAYEWGETKTETREVETMHQVIVPPMSKGTVSLLATVGSCDVPFSYTQRDVLLDGRSIVWDADDGVYTCENSYDFRVEIKADNLV